MKTHTASWTALDDQNDRKVAHLAAIARNDTINGGARAMTIARHCSQWNAAEVVADIYSRSTGKHSYRWEAWECPECGQVHLGRDNADECCVHEVDGGTCYQFACDEPEEMGVSDDNWACGTLDPNT